MDSVLYIFTDREKKKNVPPKQGHLEIRIIPAAQELCIGIKHVQFKKEYKYRKEDFIDPPFLTVQISRIISTKLLFPLFHH